MTQYGGCYQHSVFNTLTVRWCCFTINFKPKFRLRLKLKKMWNFLRSTPPFEMAPSREWCRMVQRETPWTQTMKPRPLGSRHALLYPTGSLESKKTHGPMIRGVNPERQKSRNWKNTKWKKKEQKEDTPTKVIVVEDDDWAVCLTSKPSRNSVMGRLGT